MGGVELGRWIYHITVGHTVKKTKKKGAACALYPGGALNVIDDETESAGR